LKRIQQAFTRHDARQAGEQCLLGQILAIESAVGGVEFRNIAAKSGDRGAYT
jgi:aerobic-type carbon monoxide dehydrogenase small subunit (CoxS/CutS family)